MSAVKFLGFSPDVDPSTNGAIFDCAGLIPTTRGMQTFSHPSVPLVNYPLENHLPTGMQFLQNGPFGVILAGFDTQIYYTISDPAHNWKAIGKAGGYSGGGGSNWRFESFGEYNILATQAGSEKMQQSYNVGQFTDVAASPAQARTFVVASRFVIVFSFVDNEDGTNPGDNWQCCARDDHTNWTLSPETQCAKGRLPDSDGRFWAAIEFGNDVYAFKSHAIYHGVYTPGNAEVWVWNRLPFGTGTSWINAVTKDRRGIYFANNNDVLFYNGAQMVSLMEGKIRNWYRARVNEQAMTTFGYAVKLIYDEVRDCLFFQFPAPNGIEILMFHIPTGQWGRAFPDTWGGLIACPTKLLYNGARTVAAIKSTDAKVYSLSGDFEVMPNDLQPYAVTHTFGDDSVNFDLLSARVRPHAGSLAGSFATPMHSPRMDLPFSVEADCPITDDGKFEFRQHDRWHRVKFTFANHVEIGWESLAFNEGGDRK